MAMTYDGWMSLSTMQWLQYNSFWTSALKDDLKNHFISQDQYNVIWEHRTTILEGYRDNTGAVATDDPQSNQTSSSNSLLDNAVSNVKNAVNDTGQAISNAAKGALSGLNNTVVFGVIVLVVVLIIKKR